MSLKTDVMNSLIWDILVANFAFVIFCLYVTKNISNFKDLKCARRMREALQIRKI